MTQKDLQMLREMLPHYILWETPAEALRRPVRVLAQIMNIGDFEDIRRLMNALGMEPFQEAISKAEPGWFTWHYWHYRLGLAPPGGPVPDLPKRLF